MRSPFRLVLLALLGSGCQLVFGLNEYEASGGAEPSVGGSLVGAGGAGASQAGAPAGAGGEGASGAEPSSGGAPSLWTVVGLPDVGDSAQMPPDACAQGGRRITLFGGTSRASCVPCQASPSATSCRSELLCGNGGCPVQSEPINVGTSCSDIGPFNSCGASAQSPPDCVVTGGQVAPGDTGLDRYASFCSCSDCATTCALAEGNLGGAACDPALPNAYVFFSSAEVRATCSECSVAQQSCGSKVFEIAGFGGCPLPADLDASSCQDSGGFFNWSSARRVEATSCTATGTTLEVTPVGQTWTVCCSEPLPPEFAPQQLL